MCVLSLWESVKCVWKCCVCVGVYLLCVCSSFILCVVSLKCACCTWLVTALLAALPPHPPPISLHPLPFLLSPPTLPFVTLHKIYFVFIIISCMSRPERKKFRETAAIDLPRAPLPTPRPLPGPRGYKMFFKGHRSSSSNKTTTTTRWRTK